MSFKTEILLIPLLQAISHIFGHARDHWWALDFTNAFVSLSVNSRGELVPSPRNCAPHRWLGINVDTLPELQDLFYEYNPISNPFNGIDRVTSI
jgi:hypothetical protein